MPSRENILFIDKAYLLSKGNDMLRLNTSLVHFSGNDVQYNLCKMAYKKRQNKDFNEKFTRMLFFAILLTCIKR